MVVQACLAPGQGMSLLRAGVFLLCFLWLHPWDLEHHLALKEMAWSALFWGVSVSVNSATWI